MLDQYRVTKWMELCHIFIPEILHCAVSLSIFDISSVPQIRYGRVTLRPASSLGCDSLPQDELRVTLHRAKAKGPAQRPGLWYDYGDGGWLGSLILREYPEDAGPAYPEGVLDVLGGLPLSPHLDHLLGLAAGRGLASLVLAFGLGLGDAFTLPL